MASGGYRRPSDRSPKVSGVGKNSKRTDTQAIRSPNVQDSEDLQVGDRERIRQGQRVAPLGRASSPALAAAPPGGGPLPTSGGGAGIPPLAFEMGSKRPEEPLTAGMDMGPGAGSDVLSLGRDPDDPRVLALERYARNGNPTAQRYLDRIYRPQTPMGTPELPDMPAEAEPPAMEDDFAEEDTETQALA